MSLAYTKKFHKNLLEGENLACCDNAGIKTILVITAFSASNLTYTFPKRLRR